MSARQRSILHISTGAELGGAERVLLDLARALDRERFRVHVVVPRSGSLEDEVRAAGIAVSIRDYLGAVRHLGRYSSARDCVRALGSLPHIAVEARALARFVREESVEVIHAHGIKAQLFTVGLAPLVSARIVWHVHDFLRHRRFWPVFRVLGRLVPDAIIVPSGAVARDFPPWDHVRVIPHGVDLEEFSFLPFSDSPATPRRVGMIGALAPWKGQLVFLEAVERVSQILPDVQFFVVGEEIYDTAGHRGFRALLEREVVRRGLRERVYFTGFRKEIASILRDLDLVVHCSIEPEPFGRVLIEAMACGRPVIASRGGATEEIVREGETGVLVPPGDAARLADTMLALLGDPARCAQMGRAARAHVMRRFSLDRQVREIERLYDSLLCSWK